MSTMLAFRNKVVEAMAKIPTIKFCGPIKGTLTEEGMERLSVRAPGILVALVGFRGLVPLDTGRYRANLVMSVFIVTEGQHRLERGHELLEAAALLIAGNQWGVPNTKFAQDIKGEPIYDDRYKDREERTRHLQEQGWFLQAVSWTQETTVSRAPATTTAARADDVAQAESLGQQVDMTNWPSKVEFLEFPFAPVVDTSGDNRTEER
jgi:hypothetical protein